ncbi:hypothetical protein [New Jersey aster yellows phytoplasma]|nr:hypothetical protein [New Jersey aster yellows phytoplasma]PEH36291.1 hypothetical protein BBA70_01820 [New Jersey aster yellows phytoplasma]PWV43896.1 MAG: hypothetical protein DF280_00925 ['Brassica napus' phytoplasma]
MTDSNFTIGFVSGALFVTGLCFVFKYLFFSFLQLFNPNDTYPIIIQGSFNGGNFLMVFKTNSLF